MGKQIDFGLVENAQIDTAQHLFTVVSYANTKLERELSKKEELVNPHSKPGVFDILKVEAKMAVICQNLLERMM